MEPLPERHLVLGRLLEEIIEETRRIVPRWHRFVNQGIGAVCFSLALGCLGTRHPQIYASISFIFVAVIFYAYRNYFPSTIRELRNIPRRRRTDIEEVVLRGM